MVHDQAWEMIWTTEYFQNSVQIIAEIARADCWWIAPHRTYLLGISTSNVYGFQVSIDWCKSQECAGPVRSGSVQTCSRTETIQSGPVLKNKTGRADMSGPVRVLRAAGPKE
jgi:hypothetical protein